jgi:hypothetical protein
MPLLMVLYVVLLIVAGSHLVRYRGSNGWLLAIVFLPFVGNLSYILMERRRVAGAGAAPSRALDPGCMKSGRTWPCHVRPLELEEGDANF